MTIDQTSRYWDYPFENCMVRATQTSDRLDVGIKFYGKEEWLVEFDHEIYTQIWLGGRGTETDAQAYERGKEPVAPQIYNGEPDSTTPSLEPDVVAKVHARIAYFHSPDIDDLVGYEPPNPENFGFLLQVLIGPAGTSGEESFDVQVCTPQWWTQRHGPGVVMSGRHTILLATYDWAAIERYVRSVVGDASGSDWREIEMQLDHQLGKWEYADYAP